MCASQTRQGSGTVMPRYLSGEALTGASRIRIRAICSEPLLYHGIHLYRYLSCTYLHMHTLSDLPAPPKGYTTHMALGGRQV